jgi:heme A synthase
MACPHFPLCDGESLVPSLTGIVGMHALHRLNGYALALACAAFAWRARSSPRLARLAWTMAGLVLAQIAVGAANVLLGVPVEITGLHSALAAAIALATALAVREIRAAARVRVALADVGTALEGAR